MNEPGLDEQDARDMARLAAGQDSGLNDLMERHAEKLFHYLIRLLGDETEAGDLAQEAFVRVYQHREKFRWKEKFTTWLYAIATNLARDRLRWRARHQNVSLDAETQAGGPLGDMLPHETPSPSQELERAEKAELVRKAVAGLPEELRTPLILSEYEELSHREIAEILECSAKAVETRIYRARNCLRSRLSNVLSGLTS